MTFVLERMLGVRAEESQVVGLFFAFFMGIGAFYTLGITVGDTLFLSSLSPAQVPRVVPWVYVGIAVTNVASVLVFDAVQARVARKASIVGTQLVLAVSVLAARQLVEAHASAVYLALVIWLETCALLSITLFFSLAGDYFSPRDGRRLYGLLAGGMSLGTVLGGILVNALVRFVEAADLLYVGAAMLVSNAVVAATIFRIRKPLVAHDPDGTSGRAPLRAIFARPYVRLLALIAPLAVAISVLADYQMKWVASSKPVEELARFFGAFYGWVGAAQIGVQFLIVPRILRRYGGVSALMVLPLAVAMACSVELGAVALGQVSLLVFAAAVNFVRLTLAETLDLPSRELLFLPLPTRIRRRIQPLMGAAVAPLAMGVAGAGLLVAVKFRLSPAMLAWPTILAALLFVLVLVRLRPRYRETLAETLRTGHLDPADLDALVGGEEAETMLEANLRSNDSDLVIASLALLEHRALGRLAPLVEELVGHEDGAVAAAALERLADEGVDLTMRGIERAWSSDDPIVRQAAVLALCKASGEEAVERLSESLVSDDEVFRTSVVIGMGRHCGEPGRQAVRPSIESQALSDDVDERLEAVQVLGRIAAPGYADLLLRLMGDDDANVRGSAVEAAASSHDVALVEPLLAAMAKPDLRAQAFAALAAMPPEAAGRIVMELRAPTTSSTDRAALARVLGRVGGDEAAAALWQELDPSRDLLLRLAALEGLHELAERGESGAEPPDHLDGLVRSSCEALAVLAQARGELAEGSLRTLVDDHGRLHVDLLCGLLALGHDRRAVMRIQHSLFDETASVRSRAMELVEELLPHAQAAAVSAALQGWVEAPRPSTAVGLSDATAEALIACDSWMRVAAVHHLNQGAAFPVVRTSDLGPEELDLYRLVDVVVFLKRVPLFMELPAYALREQAEIAKWVHLDADTIVFHEGADGDSLYVICAGAIGIDVGGREVARLQEGECLGELAAVDGAKRSATARAVSETTLLQLPGELFHSLLHTQPAMAHALLRTLDRRIRETQGERASRTSVRPSFPMAKVPVAPRGRPAIQQVAAAMSLLRNAELFRDLPAASMAAVAGIVEEALVYRGESLFEQGDEGDALYLIASGRIAIEVDGVVVAKLERGACLGEMALISGLPRSAGARIEEDARLLRIDAAQFERLLGASPEIMRALLMALARRLRAVSAARRWDSPN